MERTSSMNVLKIYSFMDCYACGCIHINVESLQEISSLAPDFNLWVFVASAGVILQF